MNTLNDINDNDLLKQIEDCTLEPALFTHENLLRLSWILIKRHGIDIATVKNCNLKKQYYLTVFKNDKFNLPLTKAYTEILFHFMERSSANNLDKLLREFPRLKFNFKTLVKTHYGYNILKAHRTENPESVHPTLYSF